MVVVGPGLPREVVGVDGDAVPAHAGAGIEGDETEGLGGRGGDDFPDVDTHLVADDGHFVGEGAVDDSEGVLQDLGHLRFLGCGDGEYGCLENCLIKCLGVFRTGGGAASHHLGGVLGLVEEVAGVDPLGGEGEVEVLPHGESLHLEDGLEDLLGGAGPGGGFEDHEHVPVGILSTVRAEVST